MTCGSRTPAAFWESTFRRLAASPRPLPPSVFDRGLEAAERFLGLLAPGCRILDLGCGAGRNALALARRGFRVSVCDVSRAAVRLCRRAAAAEGLSVSRVVMRKGRYLLSAGAGFGGLVVWSVLDHLPTLEARGAMAELGRVAGPGALLLGSFDSDDEQSHHQPHDVLPDGAFRFTGGKREGMLWRFYSNEEIRDLLAPEWEILVLAGREPKESRVVLAARRSRPAAP